MTERITHTDRSLKFETCRGSLEFIVNEGGLTLEVFEAIDTPGPDTHVHIRSENLPLSLAREIRDFFNYALLGSPVENSEDGHPERRVSNIDDRRVGASE